jgi:ATP-dependent Clp protease ATP-binding subunit ClpA
VYLLDSACEDARMGARPLERAVDDMIVQPLVDAIFAGNVQAGRCRAILKGGKIEFRAEREMS